MPVDRLGARTRDAFRLRSPLALLAVAVPATALLAIALFAGTFGDQPDDSLLVVPRPRLEATEVSTAAHYAPPTGYIDLFQEPTVDVAAVRIGGVWVCPEWSLGTLAFCPDRRDAAGLTLGTGGPDDLASFGDEVGPGVARAYADLRAAGGLHPLGGSSLLLDVDPPGYGKPALEVVVSQPRRFRLDEFVADNTGWRMLDSESMLASVNFALGRPLRTWTVMERADEDGRMRGRRMSHEVLRFTFEIGAFARDRSHFEEWRRIPESLRSTRSVIGEPLGELRPNERSEKYHDLLVVLRITPGAARWTPGDSVDGWVLEGADAPTLSAIGGVETVRLHPRTNRREMNVRTGEEGYRMLTTLEAGTAPTLLRLPAEGGTKELRLSAGAARSLDLTRVVDAPLAAGNPQPDAPFPRYEDSLFNRAVLLPIHFGELGTYQSGPGELPGFVGSLARTLFGGGGSDYLHAEFALHVFTIGELTVRRPRIFRAMEAAVPVQRSGLIPSLLSSIWSGLTFGVRGLFTAVVLISVALIVLGVTRLLTLVGVAGRPRGRRTA